MRGCTTFALCALAVFGVAPIGFSDQQQGSGFAVVELFTSEGCSSCPPADDALSRLVGDAEAQRLPIYALDWHVDYWDYLGWKDPWGSRIATERQQEFARTLPSSVYTPQVVVNGQFVPSYAGDLRELESLAHSALTTPVAASLRLTNVRFESPTLVRVSLEVSNAPRDSNLLIAEVEGDLSATPNAGENAGRRLRHTNVVRAAKIAPAVAGGVALEVPPATPGATRHIIAFLESASSLRIFAATRVRLGDVRSSDLNGRVLDAAGKPAQGALIQACSASVCVPARTDKNGRFTLRDVQNGSYEVDVALTAPSLAPISVQFLDAPSGVRIVRTVWRYASPPHPSR